MPEVLQKIIADAGLMSRREAAKLIKGGAIKINGHVAKLGDRADREVDIILIRNQALPPITDKIYLKLNKPNGYTCTNRVFAGEKNIFQLINLPTRLFAIGRLDKNSQGLLLVTNDGLLAQQLTHPRFGHEKVYQVEITDGAQNSIDSTAIQRIMLNLQQGINIGEGDGRVKVKKVKYLDNHCFEIVLHEGKKRQIRRMFKVLGYNIKSLTRTGFAGISLTDLKLGSWQYLDEIEINIIRRRGRVG